MVAEIKYDTIQLEDAIVSSVRKMRIEGLKPIDCDVEFDSDTRELWAWVWFREGPTLSKRREKALQILKDTVKSDTNLPVGSGFGGVLVIPSVNGTFESEVGENAIAAWWGQY